MRDYLAYGTEQVWVLYPEAGEVHVYYRDEPKVIKAYSDDDILTGGTLLPNFQVQVSAFFKLPTD